MDNGKFGYTRRSLSTPASIIAAVSALLISAASWAAQESAIAVKGKERLKVTADLLSVYPDKNYSDFVGHVVAVYSGRELTCRKLRAYFSEKTRELDRIEAQDGVRMREKDLDVTCDQLVYYKSEEKIVLSGNPRILTKGSEFRGELITMFLETRRLIIEGGVDADIAVEEMSEK